MSRYKKINHPARPAQAAQDRAAPTIGMLYVVEVRMVSAATNETIKHRLLLVGCEEADIERKLRWLFDASQFSEFSVKGVEKVREKVHYLSTSVVQRADAPARVIDRDGSQEAVKDANGPTEPYDPRLFAVGVATTMLAKDEMHALRKVARALLATSTSGESHSAATLSEDSQISIEQIPLRSGYAMPRDTSTESNRPRFVRG